MHGRRLTTRRGLATRLVRRQRSDSDVVVPGSKWSVHLFLSLATSWEFICRPSLWGRSIGYSKTVGGDATAGRDGCLSSTHRNVPLALHHSPCLFLKGLHSSAMATGGPPDCPPLDHHCLNLPSARTILVAKNRSSVSLNMAATLPTHPLLSHPKPLNSQSHWEVMDLQLHRIPPGQNDLEAKSCSFSLLYGSARSWQQLMAPS